MNTRMMQINPESTVQRGEDRGDRLINCKDSFGDSTLAELVKLIENTTGRKCLFLGHL